MPDQTDSIAKTISIAAIIGCVSFWITLIAAAALTPDYSHTQDMISELGAVGAPYPWLNAYLGMLPFGLAIVLLGILIIREFRPGAMAWLSGIFTILSGFGFVLAALTRCDVGCQESELLSANLHFLGAGVGFNAMRFSPLFLGLRSISPDRRGFYVFALLLTITYWITLFFLAGMVESLRVIGPGFWQRVTVGVISIWVVGVAISRIRSSPISGQQ